MAMTKFLKIFLHSPQKSPAKTGDVFNCVMGKKCHINNPCEGLSINVGGESTKKCLKIIPQTPCFKLDKKMSVLALELAGELLGVERHRLGSLTHQNLNVKGK